MTSIDRNGMTSIQRKQKKRSQKNTKSLTQTSKKPEVSLRTPQGKN
jgi:hypothetical protein